MAGNLISSLLSHGAKLLPSIQTSAQPHHSTSSPTTSKRSASAMEMDLKKLLRTLKRIQATLRDAEEREIRDESVKLWLKELKQVAYTADDLLDECHYEVLQARSRARPEAGCTSSENSGRRKQEKANSDGASIPIPDGMADKIRDVRSRFDEIAKDRDALHLREEDGRRRPDRDTCPPPTSYLVDESCVFGREEEKEEVIKRLWSVGAKEGVVSVLPIVGKGGLGKTTLAQLVYMDPRVRGLFDRFGWVSVSEDFDVRRLTQSIIESVTHRSCTIAEFSALQGMLKEELRDRRVFLVLDNVWNEKRSVWELLRTPFLSAKRACILVTTRNEPVAKIMQTLTPLRLRYLSEHRCWQLFVHYAFGGGHGSRKQSNLVEIGRQITKKCGGLPLAVKSLAGILRYDDDEGSWREILQSELWMSQPDNEIFPALQISFTRLPPHLKPCFMFCSIFPRGHAFDKDTLIRLWAAQGYIESKGVKTIEEVGAEYIEELTQRSFFDGPDGSILHDMVHDLARLVSEKEYFMLDADNTLDCFDEAYHLCVNNYPGVLKDLLSRCSMGLRTLILYHFRLEESLELPMPPGLRALELHTRGDMLALFNCINDLKHLRYLWITRYHFENLPDSLPSLYYLQTLALHQCFHVVALPEGFENLVNLKFLSLSGFKFGKLPKSICLLSNLQELHIISCQLDEVSDGIGNLVGLQELVLHQCEIEALTESIGKLVNLRILRLTMLEFLRMLPPNIGELANLTTLDVRGTKLSWSPNMKVLPKICKLDVDVEVWCDWLIEGFSGSESSP